MQATLVLAGTAALKDNFVIFEANVNVHLIKESGWTSALSYHATPYAWRWRVRGPPRHYLYGIHHIDICFEGRCTNKYLEMGIGYNIHLPNALY